MARLRAEVAIHGQQLRSHGSIEKAEENTKPVALWRKAGMVVFCVSFEKSVTRFVFSLRSLVFNELLPLNNYARNFNSAKLKSTTCEHPMLDLSLQNAAVQA